MKRITKYLNARTVTAVIGVIAAAFGWSESLETETINQIMTIIGALLMLVGNLFPPIPAPEPTEPNDFRGM